MLGRQQRSTYLKEFSRYRNGDSEETAKSIRARNCPFFSDQGGEINPADVNWIWKQGDSGISVREMNDSWGDTLCNYWMNDDLELRSTGTDGIFLAKMISSD